MSDICDSHLPGPLGIAIDCKFDVNWGWNRMVATVRLLKEKMGCERVVNAVPCEKGLARTTHNEVRKSGGRIATLENLNALMP